MNFFILLFSCSVNTFVIGKNIEQIILDAGVDVNIRNVHNTIPLHVALARGAKSCVGLLLSAGADCNWQVLFPAIAFEIPRIYLDRMLSYGGTVLYYQVV